MEKFKAGDLVYNPRKGTSIYRLMANNENAFSRYSLVIEYSQTPYQYDTFTEDGKVFVSSELPTIFKATEENREILSKLYGIEFEAPPAKLTPKEIIEALIDKNGFCWCRVSNMSEVYARGESNESLIRIHQVKDVFHSQYSEWAYAIPFNPLTCEEITELPS